MTSEYFTYVPVFQPLQNGPVALGAICLLLPIDEAA